MGFFLGTIVAVVCLCILAVLLRVVIDEANDSSYRVTPHITRHTKGDNATPIILLIIVVVTLMAIAGHSY